MSEKGEIEKITIIVNYDSLTKGCGREGYEEITPTFDGFECTNRELQGCYECDIDHQITYTYEPINRWAFVKICIDDDYIETILSVHPNDDYTAEIIKNIISKNIEEISNKIFSKLGEKK